ncbi:hypothetical protein HPB47_015384 [Ixodes persulcatus]|uniref:Uncharacterized protein n=1 Tax=Ixodes persulcatus TaxID=34615 RepID=A0AC60R3D2_IXOPE|nr:hypothetical protein HPB47_015384 [Ixodes persulcatus]
MEAATPFSSHPFKSIVTMIFAAVRDLIHILPTSSFRLQLTEFLPGVRKKANTPPLDLKAAAQEQLAASTHMVSSTTAELLAITEALSAMKSLPPQPIVVFTNSHGGIQRIRKPGPCPTANEVRRVARQLEEQGHSISLQWVPSQGAPDPRRYQQAIQAFFSDLSLWGSSKRSPCMAKGLKRSDATLLFRLRTGSAYTEGGSSTGLDAETLRSVSGVRSPRTRLMDLFPPNIVDVVVHSYPSEAFVRRRARGNATYFDPPDSTRVHTGDRPPHNCTPLATDGATPHPLKEAKNPRGPSPPNGLGLVAFSVGVGFVLAHSADDRNVLLNFFIGLSNNLMSASRAMMWYAPVGALSLIASRILLASQAADGTQEMSSLRPYVLVLLVAVCVHTFLVLPLLQRLVLCRFRDVALFSFYGRIYNALLMSAATASGAATLPVAVYALEQNSGLDARVARFVAPVGVIINRSGMALYLSVSGIFLAQIYKAELDLWDLSAISMRAAVASMSEPGITRGIKGHIALAGLIMGMDLQEVAILEGGLIFVRSAEKSRAGARQSVLSEAGAGQERRGRAASPGPWRTPERSTSKVRSLDRWKRRALAIWPIGHDDRGVVPQRDSGSDSPGQPAYAALAWER